MPVLLFDLYVRVSYCFTTLLKKRVHWVQSVFKKWSVHFLSKIGPHVLKKRNHVNIKSYYIATFVSEAVAIMYEFLVTVFVHVYRYILVSP